MLFLLAAATIMMTFSGCTDKEDKNNKIKLYVGHWPRNQETRKAMERDSILEKIKRDYEQKYPHVEVITNNYYLYNPDTFEDMARENRLPAFLDVYFTEVSEIIDSGYAADITDELRNNGLLDKLSPDMLELVSYDNGKICGIPSYIYAQGLVINKEIFRQAGLVLEDGTPMIPRTYEELGEVSKIIREKTGKAGFCIPISENCGGWVFMNIAWSYGVEFEEQEADGSWRAVFNSEECKNALSYVYDLKWKYDALPHKITLGLEDYKKTFAEGNVAMAIFEPGAVESFVKDYGMNKDDIYFAKLPAGPEGRYTQIGGGVRMFFAGTTPEQNDAAIKWLMMEGYTPNITPEIEEILRRNYEHRVTTGGIIMPKELLGVWRSDERDAKMEEILADYANVEAKNYEDYYDFTGMTLRTEEPVCCQQLYSVLDNVIYNVITDPNVNMDVLLSEATEKFQTTYLDKK